MKVIDNKLKLNSGATIYFKHSPQMNWKDKLELKYTKEEAHYGTRMAAVLHCSWRGFLLMRKSVDVKKSDFDFDRCKLLLKTWFDKYVLNYEDLTTRQKRRIKNFPFVGTDEAPTSERYGKLYDYVDSEFLKYAKIKIILVRVNYVRGETSGYQVRSKSVICELL